MDKVILSINKCHHECVLGTSLLCLFSEDRQCVPPSKNPQPQGIVLFLLAMCLDEY